MELVASGKTIIAALLVSFNASHTLEQARSGHFYWQTSKMRAVVQQALDESIVTCLSPSKNVAMKKFEVSTQGI